MPDPTEIAELVRTRRDELSPAERRVADVVLTDPQFVAFGTVAQLAQQAGTSGASVVRFASRLGLDGFGDLQDRVRADLTRQLHQASERLQRPDPCDLLTHAAATLVTALSDTLHSLRREDFDSAVELLADPRRQVFVGASDAGRGVGQQLASELAMVRHGVVHLDGSPVAVHRSLAALQPGDAMVALDLPRYDRWLLGATAAATAAGAQLIALTDSHLSTLARDAHLVVVVGSTPTGPFDSQVAALAVAECLVAGVAQRRRRTAASHLAHIEASWAAAEVLSDD